MSDLERYISDNALRVSDALSISYIARAHGNWQFFGLSDRSIVDYVVASGKHAHQRFVFCSVLTIHPSILRQVS